MANGKHVADTIIKSWVDQTKCMSDSKGDSPLFF